MLSRQAAIDLFEKEAALFDSTNGIPEYRVMELFGEWAISYFENNRGWKRIFECGEDWNTWGSGNRKRPFIHFLYRQGFFKIVSEHNYRLSFAAHRESEAGKIIDILHQKQDEQLEE